MTKKTRKLLFCFLILGFIVVAGAFLLYALGWSLDQTAEGGLTFKKTGAIFLKIRPNDATIKINNKPYNRKRGLFGNGGSELVKGLLPGEYQIEVFKNNFGDWKKNLTVEAGLISSVSKIFLFPNEVPQESITQKEAEKFWLTDSKKEEIKKIFYSLKQKELKMPGLVPITQINAFPFDTSKTLIASQKALYLLNQENFTLELLAQVSIKTFATNGSEIVFIDQENNLQFYDLIAKKITKKITLPLNNNKGIIKIAFSRINTQIGFLTEEGGFFIYKRPKQELKLIAEGIKDFRFSLDNKKIATLTLTDELEVIFLEEYRNDFQMAAGEKLKLNLSKDGKPLDFDWLPEILDYLIIKYQDETIAAEVDKRPPANWWSLGKNIKDFAFDQENNLYFLENGQFLKANLK